MSIHVIYMAAGNGRRFAEEIKRQERWKEGEEWGRDTLRANKLFYPLAGRPLYRHCLERLAELSREGRELEIYLVSQYRELLSEAAALPVTCVYSPRSALGVSWTIRAGLAAAGMSGGCAFFAADQPYLSRETMERFFGHIQREPEGLSAVGLGAEPGNPCYFGPGYLPELLGLTGDQGGKSVLRRHLEDCRIVQAKGAWELEDVDVPPGEEPLGDGF